MSGKNTSSESMIEIFKGFERLSTQNLEASNERQKKSDDKIDTLTDSINKLLEHSIESKNNREHDLLRQERFEENQKKQGEQIQDVANAMILVKERQSNSKSKTDKYADIGHKVLTTIITLAIIAEIGLNR